MHTFAQRSMHRAAAAFAAAVAGLLFVAPAHAAIPQFTPLTASVFCHAAPRHRHRRADAPPL